VLQESSTRVAMGASCSPRCMARQCDKDAENAATCSRYSWMEAVTRTSRSIIETVTPGQKLSTVPEL